MGQEQSQEQVDDSVVPRTLESRNIQSVAKLIKDGNAKRIVVLTGAGVSTNAGIPDFRSPDTGIYANLARLDLPYAEAVFDISYFRGNPHPFYTLARELYPGKYKPTISHAFVALLAKKDLLCMLFTQNIDCLEREAGVPSEKIVEAHGSFATQRCIDCATEYPDDLMITAIESGDVPHCLVPQCNGLVKPDIVFFGEQLPKRFFDKQPCAAQAQLMLVIGTSLSVQPFASLPQFALEGVPRVLFNLERVGGLGSRPDDVCVLSDCDEGIRQLADALGWTEELEALWKEKSGSDVVDQDPADPNATTKSKDELLEDAITKLTQDVDQTLKVSSGHQKWLESHLSGKHSLNPLAPESDRENAAPHLDVKNSAASSQPVDDYEADTAKEKSTIKAPVAVASLAMKHEELISSLEPTDSSATESAPNSSSHEPTNSTTSEIGVDSLAPRV